MKKRSKQLVSFMMAGIISLINSAFAAEPAETASIILGEKVIAENMTVKYGQKNEFYQADTPVVRQGRPGWNLVPKSDWLKTELCVNIRDNYAYNISDGTCYEVEVDYFDEGEGKFRLLYDATTEPWQKGAVEQVERSEIVQLTDTGEWKTETFFLEHPKFKNNYKEADFSVSINDTDMGVSPASVVIGEIRLKPVDTKSLIRIQATTNEIGNNFFSDQPVSVDLALYNQTNEEQNVKVHLTAYNMEGKKSWEETLPVDFAPRGAEKQTVTFTPSEHSIFKLFIEAEAENIYSCKTMEFSYSTANQELNPFFGTNNHTYTYPTRYADKLAPLVKKAGISMSRETMRWYNYEAKPGVYQTPNWIINRMNEFQKQNIEQMIVISNENPALWNHRQWVVGELEENACLEHAKAMVSEYKGKFKYYEIFNEVNSAVYEGCDVDWYVRQVKRMYTELKKIDPEIQIIIGVTSEVPVGWIKEVCEKTVGYYDGFSIHPYSMKIAPMDADSYGAVLSARKTIDAAGGEGKPLWISEIGWPTAYVSYEESAAYNMQFYAMMTRPELNIAKVLYYDFQDDGLDPLMQESNFGIIRPWADCSTPFLAKPGYLAAANINSILTNAEFVECNDQGGDQPVTYRYKRPDGQDVLMLWAYPENQQVTMDLGSEDVVVYNIYGTKMDVYQQNGTYSMFLDEKPVYMVGHFDKAEKIAPVIAIDKMQYDAAYDDVLELNIKKSISEEAEIEVELPKSGYVSLEQNDGFSGQQAKVLLRTKGNNGKQDEVTLNIRTKDGKFLAAIQVTLHYTNAISLEFMTSPADTKHLTRWVATARIKNNNHQKPLRGYLRFCEPEDFYKKLGDIKIPEIKPGTTMDVTFNLPEMRYYQARHMNVEIVCEDGYRESFEFYSDCLSAVYADVKPQIDGKMSPGEWHTDMKLKLLAPNFYTDFLFGSGTYTGNNDLSADVYLEWDEENLYIFADVTDDIHLNNKNADALWMSDSIQIGVSYNGVKNPRQARFTEIGFALIPEGPVIVRYTNEAGATGQTVDSECAVVVDKNKTCYEIKMPWKELLTDGAEIKAGDQVRFNMIINEDDGGGRMGWLEYSAGIGQIKDASQFGWLNLIDNR